MVTVYTVYAALAVIHDQTVRIDQTCVPYTSFNVTVFTVSASVTDRFHWGDSNLPMHKLRLLTALSYGCWEQDINSYVKVAIGVYKYALSLVLSLALESFNI